MKKSELIFNVISVPLDFLLILASASAAYFLRYRVETLPVIFDLNYGDYLKLVLAAIPFLQILFALNGLYTQRSTRGILREIGKIATAVSAGLMIVVVLFFFNRNLFPSRLIILASWIFIIAAVSLGRGLLLYLERKFLQSGVGLHRLIAIVGNDPHKLIDEIEANPRLGFEIVGKFTYRPEVLQEIEKLHREKKIDELLQADQKLSNDAIYELVRFCDNLGIKFNYLPNILESHRANIETDTIGNTPIVRLRTTPLEGWGKVVKRIMDIVISALALIILSPVFLVIAIIIKLDSRGPVFFRQNRGSSFHNFMFYKFRTMYAELSEGTPRGEKIRAELEKLNARHGPYVKIKNDPRVTRFGRLLRRTKLDELPQLWHILRGQMSLVGPRIHMVKEVEKFESRYKKIFTIKPGATGLAQINQIYNPELPFEEEVKLDLFYIENWSVWLDFYIMFKTIFLLLFPRRTEDY